MPNLSLRGIPEDLYRRLKDTAELNHRSLNGEILARLEASLRPPSRDVDALLDRIRERRERDGVELSGEELRALREHGRE